jgi:hypothetical protein
VDFFTSAVDNDTIGLGVAVNNLWIWMIPVTLGWVWVGTQNSASTIREALMSIEASVEFPLHKVKGQMTSFKDCSDENFLISKRMDLKAGNEESYPNTLNHIEVTDNGHQGAIEMTDMTGTADAGRTLLTKTTPIKTPPRRTILGSSIAGYALEPGPIFNYARVWNHLRMAEYVGNAFCALNANLKEKRPVQGNAWVEDPHRWKENLEGWRTALTSANTPFPDTSATDEASLTGKGLNHETPSQATPTEIEGYIFSRFNTECSDPPGITQNFIVATAVALILQWGTTGSAILIAYESVSFFCEFLYLKYYLLTVTLRTPVIGLGCESVAICSLAFWQLQRGLSSWGLLTCLTNSLSAPLNTTVRCFQAMIIHESAGQSHLSHL